mgnify:CR=1 FL=1
MTKIAVLITGQLNRNSKLFFKKNFCRKVKDFDLFISSYEEDISYIKMINQKNGNIINISSDLGIIAPNQFLYEKNNKKPVSYSVVKHGIIGFSKYLATYLADYNIRSNSFCPGGISNNQPRKFVNKIKKLIPLKRMAEINDYDGIILYLCSDYSSYMTGSTIVCDGGRSSW